MAFNTLFQLLYPKNIKCLVCSGELAGEDEYSICPDCKKFNEKFCLRCGRAIKNMADYCNRCMNRKWEFESARSVFEFESVKGAVHKFKYGGQKYMAENFALFMRDVYLNQKLTADIITFVPLHPKRQRKRGYNQAEELAINLSQLLDLSVYCLLEKTVYTKNMAKLKADERQKLIENSFAIAAQTPKLLKKYGTMPDIKGKNIILVDDIFTTGCTANECSRMLKKAGCAKITVLTVASVASKPMLY